jgi:hypothetical protein
LEEKSTRRCNQSQESLEEKRVLRSRNLSNWTNLNHSTP